jgi:hypothetical protein
MNSCRVFLVNVCAACSGMTHTWAIWSNLPNSSLSVMTRSDALSCSDSGVKFTMSAYRMLQQTDTSLYTNSDVAPLQNSAGTVFTSNLTTLLQHLPWGRRHLPARTHARIYNCTYKLSRARKYFIYTTFRQFILLSSSVTSYHLSSRSF